MILILNSISAVIIYTVSFIFFNTMYSRNEKSKWLMLSAYVLAVLLMVRVTSLGNSIINITYLFLSFNIINKVFYKCQSLIFIIYNALLSLIMVVTDISAALILSSINHLSVGETLNNKSFHIIRYLLAMLLLFACFRVFVAFIKKSEVKKIKIHELLLYLILTVIEVFTLYYISNEITMDSNGIELITTLAVYLFLDFYIAFLIYRISKNSQLEHELSLARQQSNMQQSVYKELFDKYQISRGVPHDMKKHIKSLEGLIDNKFVDKAQEYTQLLNQEIEKLVPDYENDNQILSVIICDNLIQAKKQNILLELDVQNVSMDFISDLDITAIFANILDNAMEACDDLEGIDRRIKVIVQERSGFLIVNVSNKYKGIIQEKKGFLTTKKGHEGVGLSNVKNTVEKYDGIFDIETKDHVFRVKITIPITESI